jgi:hypothetical protein
MYYDNHGILYDLKITEIHMNNKTNYLLKNIPTELWKDFKRKALDEDVNNYGQILIELIKTYTKNTILVGDISKGSYVQE